MADLKFIEGQWIFDIETYPNCYTFCAVYSNGKGIRTFEISDRKNEVEEMLEFLRKVATSKHKLVGFNNVGFDYPVIHYILEKSKKAKVAGKPLAIKAKEIYDVAMKLIRSQNDEKFGNAIRDKEVKIPQVDLFKIHHFDNKARATSLKMLEFNMQSDNIEDLPYPLGTVLKDHEIDELIKYNKHDVLQTLKFYKESIEAISFREKLTEKYGFDCTNFNDTKIGKQYFINRLEKAMPGSCYTKNPHGGRTINQTKRPIIYLKDAILPYIKYEREEFKALLKWFKTRSITETKGVFSDVLEKDLGELAKYSELTTKKRKLKTKPTEEELVTLKEENSLSWVEEIELKGKETKANGGGQKKAYWLNWKVAETLNVVVDGFRLDFGTGGIHGSVESTIVRSDDDYVIDDRDVASYYPNLAISNNVYPKHLGQNFCKIYKDVYIERKSHPKGSPENAVMKLALNGVYGDSNSEFSPFYDPLYTMTITVSGQLSLCMLVEDLLKVEGLKMVQANTDGITFKHKRSDDPLIDKIVSDWEVTTKLEMERNDYSMMAIRDVNSYIAIFEKGGKVKRKGAYEYADLDWNKNFSSLVIPKAAEHEILGRGTVEEFIEKHENKWDFMLRTKVPRSSRLIMVMPDGTEVAQQNICRYYPAKEGGKLVKIMPALEGKEDDGDRRLSIDKEWNVNTCNDIKDFKWGVDYEYYISEARKLVDPLMGKEIENSALQTDESVSN